MGKLLSASIGSNPSLRDVLRMARPTPKDNARRALFGWLTDKQTEKWAPATEADLPAQVQGLIAYRQAETAEAQASILGNLSVRWDLLADAAKGPLVWKAIARQMGPQALRMNLNTLLRHEVFSAGSGKGDQELADYVAARIADADEIRRSRQFPYQFLAAYLNADASPSAYGHLAAFVRNAPEAQRHALWRTVGQAMWQRLGPRPVWLSTAGGGVSWLHVRLDDRPKYYGYKPYRQGLWQSTTLPQQATMNG